MKRRVRKTITKKKTTLRKQTNPKNGIKTQSKKKEIEETKIEETEEEEEGKKKKRFLKLKRKKIVNTSTCIDEFFKVFTDNVSIMNMLSFGILTYFINHHIVCSKNEIEKFFSTIPFSLEVYCSENKEMSLEKNVIIVYPFGFDQFEEIRLIFKKSTYVKEDIVSNDFLRMIVCLVFYNKFQDMAVIMNGIKYYNFMNYKKKLEIDIIQNIKNYFVLFLSIFFDHPFLFKAFQLNSFICSKERIPYCAKPFIIEEEEEKKENKNKKS